MRIIVLLALLVFVACSTAPQPTMEFKDPAPTATPMPEPTPVIEENLEHKDDVSKAVIKHKKVKKSVKKIKKLPKKIEGKDKEA